MPEVADVIGDDDIEPEGVELIPEEGMGETIVGFQTKASIPPISPKRNPRKNPPTAVNQLSIDRIRTMAPHILALAGLLFIITPPTIMIIPKSIPTTPTTVTAVPAVPPFAKYPKVPEM